MIWTGLIIAFIAAISADCFCGGGSLPLSAYGGRTGLKRNKLSALCSAHDAPPYAAAPSDGDFFTKLYFALAVICAVSAWINQAADMPSVHQMPVTSILAPFYVFFEPIYAALALTLMSHHRLSVRARLFFTAGAVVLWITQNHTSPTPEMLALNAFAPIHIACARAAKMTVLAALCTALSDEKYTQHIVKMAFAIQGSALVFGMIWAFSAPDWGSLWNWDFIELTALSVWIALYAWMVSPRQIRIWGTAAAALWLIQWLVVYQLGGSDAMTRHRYTDPGQNIAHAAVMAVYIAFLFLSAHRRRDAGPLDGRMLAAAAVLAALTGISAFGIEFQNGVLYAVFGAIWGIIVFCAGRRASHAVIGAGIALWLALLPHHVETDWAQIDEPQIGTWHLDGVHAQNEFPGCTDYRLAVHYGSQSGEIYEIGMRNCGGDKGPTDHADILTTDGILRIWCIDYRAGRGAALAVRNVTSDWLLIAFLLAALLSCWCIWGFHAAVRPSDCACRN